MEREEEEGIRRECVERRLEEDSKGRSERGKDVIRQRRNRREEQGRGGKNEEGRGGGRKWRE